MRNSFETAQISPTKRHDTKAACSRCLLRMCFHSLKIIPTEKKVIFSSVSLSLSLWVILAAVSVRRRPSPTELSSIMSWTPSWRISQNYKSTQIQMYVCSCNSQQSRGVAPMNFHKEIIFEMKSVEGCLW